MSGSSGACTINPGSLSAAELIELIDEFRRYNPVPAPATLRMTTAQYERLKEEIKRQGIDALPYDVTPNSQYPFSAFVGIPIEIDDNPG